MVETPNENTIKAEPIANPYILRSPSTKRPAKRHDAGKPMDQLLHHYSMSKGTKKDHKVSPKVSSPPTPKKSTE